MVCLQLTTDLDLIVVVSRASLVFAILLFEMVDSHSGFSIFFLVVQLGLKSFLENFES